MAESESEEGSSQLSGADTDIWSESDSELDAHLHTRGEFFGCYLLISQNPKFKGRIYIGFTVDPNRRLKQHNLGCDKGGARKTSGRGPWEMVLLVHGFPNHIAALRFEWAWQNPARSRRLGKSLARKKRTESHFQYRFRILTEMLSVGPWCRLPLTIRWLKQEYQLQFAPDKQPPIHMPIAYGPVDLAKPVEQDGSLSRPTNPQGGSQLREGGLGEDTGSRDDNVGGCVGVDLQQRACLFCANCSDNDQLLFCYHKHCTLSAHVTCLAPRLSGCGRTGPHVIPVSGECPKCGLELLWGELVRIHKASGKIKGDGVESAPMKKRKVKRVSSSQSKKRARVGNSHWSEALHKS